MVVDNRAWGSVAFPGLNSVINGALAVAAKGFIDYFIYTVSPAFGVYGIDVNGAFFADSYWFSWLVYLIVLAPYVIYTARQVDSYDCALSFLFLSVFVPTVSLYWIQGGDVGFLLFSAVFWAGLFLALVVIGDSDSARVTRVSPSARAEKVFQVLYCGLIVCLGGLLVLNFSLTTGLGFDTVYERRSQFSAWLGGGIKPYLYAWSVYVFSMFLLFVSQSRFVKFVGIIYILLFYAAAGDKVYLFIPFLILLIKQCPKLGGVWVLSSFFIAVSLAGTVSFAVGDVWISSLAHRLITMPADIAFNYMEYFSGELFLYSYSFLSAFSDYRYLDLPATLVGHVYYTDGDNATVNFLADAYLNMGWYALIPLTFFFTVLRATLADSRYLIVIVPIFIQAIDTPLPIILLTGGGGLMVLSCLILSGRLDTLLARLLVPPRQGKIS